MAAEVENQSTATTGTWLSATSEKQRSTPLGREEEEGAGQPWGVRGGRREAERIHPPARRAACHLAAPVLGHGGQRPGSGELGSAAAGVPHEGPSYPQGDQEGSCRPQPLEAARLLWGVKEKYPFKEDLPGKWTTTEEGGLQRPGQ